MSKTKLKPLKIDTFIADIHVRANTQLAYRRTLNVFERFLGGRDPTEDNGEDEARAFLRSLAERGLKETSIARHGYTLKHYFMWRRKIILLELPRPQRKLKPWMGQDDIQRLVSVAQNPFEKALVMVPFDTAIRIGELRGLKGKDIDWEKGFIFINRKGGREDWTTIGAVALNALREYDKWRKGKKGKNDLLFPFSYDYLRKRLNKLGKRGGIDNLNSHDLRHSRASTLRESGVPLEDIQDLLGHANSNTTRIYARIKPQSLKERIPEAF